MIIDCAHQAGFPLYPVSARAFVTKCNDKVYSDGKLKSPYVHARHGYDESQMVFRSSFPVFTVLQFHNVPPNLPGMCVEIDTDGARHRTRRPATTPSRSIPIMKKEDMLPIVIGPSQAYRISCTASPAPPPSRTLRRRLFSPRRRRRTPRPHFSLHYTVYCVETPIVYPTPVVHRFWQEYIRPSSPSSVTCPPALWRANDAKRLATVLMTQRDADKTRFDTVMKDIFTNDRIAPHREQQATKTKWKNLFDAVAPCMNTLTIYARDVMNSVAGEVDDKAMQQWCTLLLVTILHRGETGFTVRSKLQRKTRRLQHDAVDNTVT